MVIYLFIFSLTQISRIKEHCPDRQFILVGDSGEKDPEVYRTILERYPDQVKEIIIRDVVNDREINPGRLEGMTVIPHTQKTPRHIASGGLDTI